RLKIIAFIISKRYTYVCRTRWGGSGALYLAIRYSKTEFLSEVNDFKVCVKELVLTFRSCATEPYEPCQSRKEAAVSRFFCVPRDSLDRAMNLSKAWDYFIDDRCTVT